MKSHLMPIVLVSLLTLTAAAVLNYKSTTNRSSFKSEQGCVMTIEGYIRKDTTGNIPRLIFVSHNQERFQPVIESNNCTLTENSHIEICASSIDTSDTTHKTIHINKVVFLP